MTRLIGGHTLQPRTGTLRVQLHLSRFAALASLREILYWIEMSENAVAQQIVDAAYRVHTTLGPGLLESVYEAALAYELERRGLHLTRQQPIPGSMRRFASTPGFTRT